MKRVCAGMSVVLGLLLLSAAASKAEVKTEEKTLMKFEGMLGRMMGLFGGKAMKDGITQTVAVRGNRKATLSPDTGEIIDLDEEKVYRLDMKKKTYQVVTFADLRREMEEAQEKAAEAMKREPEAAPPQDQKQMQIDVEMKESGQKRSINGYDCREVIMTVTTHEKGKTLEQGGGMVLTSNIWLGPVIPYLKEIRDFDLRYAQKLQGPTGFGAADAQQMAAAMAMYPAMKDMFGKIQTERVNMDGTEILTIATMESVKSAEQMQQQQQNPDEAESKPASIGGIGGMLGRKLMKKKPEDASGRPANRAVIFTTQHELLRIAPAAADADVAVPAGFKARN